MLKIKLSRTKQHKILKSAFGLIPLIGILALESFGTSANISGKKRDNLDKFNIVLGAQSASGRSGFLSLEDRKTYSLHEAAEQQNKIDIIYAYGTQTGINLLSPGTGRLRTFGKTIIQNVVTVWKTFNKGHLINLGQDKTVRSLFKKIRTKQQLVEAYRTWRKKIKTSPGYDLLINGPSLSLREIEVGDIILFKSDVKDLYSVMRITDSKKGYSGSIAMDVKVSSN